MFVKSCILTKSVTVCPREPKFVTSLVNSAGLHKKATHRRSGCTDYTAQSNKTVFT